MNRSFATAIFTVAMLALLPSACRREHPRELLPTPLRLSPVDSAQEGELGESQQSAFGLLLPRGMRVVADLGDTVYARGLVGYDATKRYLRNHVQAERELESPTKLVLFNAKLSHRPEDKVQVELSKAGGRIELVVRDRRRKPAEPGLTSEQRWRQAGLTPDGRVVENQAQ